MKTKLTLSIDKEILKETKKYFKGSDKSLSELIEDYFKKILKTRKRDTSTSVVESTKGILADYYKDKSYEQMKDEMMRDKYGV